MHSLRHLGIVLLLAVFSQTPVSAHNGAVGLAVPVTGISVDGDLGDWPAGMRSYSLTFVVAGTPPRSEADFTGTFRIGYEVSANALYVAVEVLDESLVTKPDEWHIWNSQDGCQVSVDWEHGAQVHLTQYTVYGDQGRAYVGSGVVELADREEVRLGVRRRQGVHQYEWRIDMSRLSAGKLQLRPGMVLGLGVAASDVDADGSASWLGWGSVVANPFAPLDDLGDVMLVANEAQVGRVEGALVWDDTGEAVRYGDVQLEQLGMQIVARTDRTGRYGVEVPAGRYSVTPWIGGEQQEVEVKPVSMAEASVRVRVPEGEVTLAGEGRRKKMGSGVHQGLWTTWERQDGLPAYVCALAQDQRGKMWFAHLGKGVSYCDGEDCVEFTPEDGLPAHEVLALHADQQGNMWLGTDGGGVVRYDGKEFKIFTTREGLAHDVVRAIGEDRQGRLWFGTQGGGVNCYNGERFTTFTAEDGLGNNTVQAIGVDRQGVLWFGTWGGGVSRYDGKEFKTFTTRDGLADNFVQAIFADHEGKLWFGTQGGGVSRYDGKAFKTYTTREGLADIWVNAIAEDRQGNLWFAIRGMGISRYDGKAFKTYTTREGLADIWVNAIAEDRQGNLWFAIRGMGISRYDGKAFKTYTTREGVGFNGATAVLEDREGNLWFGNWGGGVSSYTGARFASLTAAEGLAGNNAWAAGEDGQGNLWFALRDGGVSRYEGKAFTTFTPKEGLAHTCIRSLLIDHQGVLWFGSEKKGVSRYDGKKWQTFTSADGLVNDDVVAIAEDHQGNVWFGTEKGGVSRFDGQSFVNFTTTNGLPDNNVLPLLVDRHGVVWVGTDKGIWRYDGQGFTTLGETEGLSVGGVSALMEDHQGMVWVGGGNGLNQWDGTRFSRHFTSEDGLPEGPVRCLLEDQQGRLWIGSDGGGVGVFDGQVFQRLGRRDGLAHDVVNDILMDHRGDLWFATQGGVSRYRPGHALPLIFPKDVVADRPYGPVEAVELPTSQDYLAFEFRAVSFRAPDELIYRYRLQGYDREWRTTRNLKAEYRDLPIGEYVFEVQAVDQDLNYSERPARVQVKVHLPYGRLAWIAALVVAVGVGCWQTGRVIGRGRQLRQANQALSEANKELFRVSQAKSSFLASMSHELRTPMNAILGFAQFLRGNREGNLNGQQLSNLEVIGRNAGELLILIEQLLDLSRIEAGRMKVVAEYFEIREVVAESLAVVEPLVGEKAVALWADYEGAHQVFYTDRTKVKQILVNLLSNAIKFTEEGRVGVWVKGEDGLVRLTVMDSGVGIAEEHLEMIFEEFRQVRHPGTGQGTGLGLAITRRLCRLLGGEVSVASVPGQGSTFTVTLPVEWRGLEKEG